MKRGATAHAKTRNKAVRQEALREYLSARGLVDSVLDDVKQLRDLDTYMAAESIRRVGKAIDTNLKLINKFLPDLKAIEITGNEDNPLVIRDERTLDQTLAGLAEIIASREGGLIAPADGEGQVH